MRAKIYGFFEQCLFEPNFAQKIIVYLLLPLSCVYYCLAHIRRLTKQSKCDMGIKVVSIGNLTIGGSGKTPMSIALAKQYIRVNKKSKCDKISIVLRGYGRESRGLVVVAKQGIVQCDVKTSGDEAMLLSNSIACNVIVSEDKKQAITKAKEMGSEIVFVDDGFSLIGVKKFDILLKSAKEPTNSFVLPSGCYREPKSFYRFSDLTLQEGVDFYREVYFYKPCKNKNTSVSADEINTKVGDIVLVSAISRCHRLLKFLPDGIEYEFFEDHHSFCGSEIEQVVKKYKKTNILVTAKDYVKLKELQLKIADVEFYVMDVEIKFYKSVEFDFLIDD